MGDIKGKSEITITKSQAAKIKKAMRIKLDSLQSEFKVRKVIDLKIKFKVVKWRGMIAFEVWAKIYQEGILKW